MNISKKEQRVLHVLAQGGFIRYERADNGKLNRVECYTHDGMILSDCTLDLVQKLKQKKLIKSNNSKPYRISGIGRRTVMSQLNNRVV